jgi:hypothetical protein
VSRGRVVSAFGQVLSVAAWAKLHGVPCGVIHSRLHRGWPGEKAVTYPLCRTTSEQSAVTFKAFGHDRTVREWSTIYGLPMHTIYSRLGKGNCSIEAAVSMPAGKAVKHAGRPSRVVSAFGKELTAVAWQEQHGVNSEQILKRIDRGWTAEQAIVKPRWQPRTVEACGQHRTVKEWSALHGVPIAIIRHRLASGRWAPADAVSAPPGTRSPSSIAQRRATRDGLPADRVVAAHGCAFTLAEWAHLNDLSVSVIASRLRLGMRADDAVSRPVSERRRAMLTVGDETLDAAGWARRSGIPVATIRSRIRSCLQGMCSWTPEQIVTTPLIPTNKATAPKYERLPGWPGSISWEIEPWATDSVARQFVKEHPDGAIVDDVCKALGMADSQVRLTEQTALHKLRVLALSGDADALRFLGSLVADARDVSELLDGMADNYPRAESAANERMAMAA